MVASEQRHILAWALAVCGLSLAVSQVATSRGDSGQNAFATTMSPRFAILKKHRDLRSDVIVAPTNTTEDEEDCEEEEPECDPECDPECEPGKEPPTGPPTEPPRDPAKPSCGLYEPQTNWFPFVCQVKEKDDDEYWWWDWVFDLSDQESRPLEVDGLLLDGSDVLSGHSAGSLDTGGDYDFDFFRSAIPEEKTMFELSKTLDGSSRASKRKASKSKKGKKRRRRRRRKSKKSRPKSSDYYFDFDYDDEEEDGEEDLCLGALIDRRHVMITSSCYEDVEDPENVRVHFPTAVTEGPLHLGKGVQRSGKNVIVKLHRSVRFAVPRKQDNPKPGSFCLNSICLDQPAQQPKSVQVLRSHLMSDAFEVEATRCPSKSKESKYFCIKNKFGNMEFEEGALLMGSKDDQSKYLIGLYSEDSQNWADDDILAFQRFNAPPKR